MNKKLIQLILFSLGMFISLSSKSDLPPDPILLSVSVINGQGFVKLTWYQENAISVTHYQIDRWGIINQQFTLPSSEVNISNDTISWIDTEIFANNERLMYQIRSFSNLESSQFSASIPTIFQREPDEQNSCERKISLYWSEYGIGSPIQRYKIHYLTEGGQEDSILINTNTLEIITTEPALGNTSYEAPVYKYILEGLSPSINYQFWIEADFDNTNYLNASSNIRENLLDPIPQPRAPVIDFITVNDDNQVEINALISQTNSNTIRIQRSLEQFFTEVNFQVDLSIFQTFPYTDIQGQPDENSYYYSISLLDQCNVAINCPQNHRTILLKGNYVQDRNAIELSWNHYEGFEVSDYEIWRIQGEATWEKIDTLLASSTTYTDDLQILQNEENVLKYKVIAIGNSNFSESNRLNLQLDYSPIFPTAFNPLSTVPENTVFKPISDFYNSNGYQLLVYDRWGGLVWSTLSPSEGWNGRDAKGKLCQKGVYVYQLSYKDQNNLPYQLNGSVTLIY